MQITIKQLILMSVALLSAAPTVVAEEEAIIATDAYSWRGDTIYQGTYKAWAPDEFSITSTYQAQPGYYMPIDSEWKLKNDISGYPQLTTPNRLHAAIYNMGLDEMVNAVEPDTTLRTGKAWGGVWTRDVSYSIILSMAYMQPTASMVSLIYANGNGPTSIENKCAVRTLSADGKEIGVIVMPQRGSGEWTDWGRSSILKLPLKAGHHTLTIDLRPENENMNLVTNHAAIDRIELVRIKDGL